MIFNCNVQKHDRFGCMDAGVIMIMTHAYFYLAFIFFLAAEATERRPTITYKMRIAIESSPALGEPSLEITNLST